MPRRNYEDDEYTSVRSRRSRRNEEPEEDNDDIPAITPPRREQPRESLMERMRREKQKIDSGRGKYWKPPLGDSYIRILPSWQGEDGDFRLNTPTHYRVGPNSRTVPCLKQFNENCPMCQRADKLAGSSNASDQKKAFEMMPKVRVLMNVLPDNDPNGEIKIWSVSPTMFSDLLGYYTNTGWGDFTDPKTGYCITVNSRKDGAIIKYSFTPDRDSTRIGKKGWRESLHDLDRELQKNRKSRAEAIAIMRGEEDRE